MKIFNFSSVYDHTLRRRKLPYDFALPLTPLREGLATYLKAGG